MQSNSLRTRPLGRQPKWQPSPSSQTDPSRHPSNKFPGQSIASTSIDTTNRPTNQKVGFRILRARHMPLTPAGEEQGPPCVGEGPGHGNMACIGRVGWSGLFVCPSLPIIVSVSLDRSPGHSGSRCLARCLSPLRSGGCTPFADCGWRANCQPMSHLATATTPTLGTRRSQAASDAVWCRTPA
jgi:hypothetical protein